MKWSTCCALRRSHARSGAMPAPMTPRMGAGNRWRSCWKSHAYRMGVWQYTTCRTPGPTRTALAHAWLLEMTTSASSTRPRVRHASGMSGMNHSWCSRASRLWLSTDVRAPRSVGGTRSGRVTVVSSGEPGNACSICSTTRSDPAYEVSHSWAMTTLIVRPPDG